MVQTHLINKSISSLRSKIWLKTSRDICFSTSNVFGYNLDVHLHLKFIVSIHIDCYKCWLFQSCLYSSGSLGIPILSGLFQLAACSTGSPCLYNLKVPTLYDAHLEYAKLKHASDLILTIVTAFLSYILFWYCYIL